jgi:hypothetical protein
MMNLVDLITSQMTGDVVGKLGELVGASEADTRTATNAAIPALLQAFSGLASSGKGADQLATAMGGLGSAAARHRDSAASAATCSARCWGTAPPPRSSMRSPHSPASSPASSGRCLPTSCRSCWA